MPRSVLRSLLLAAALAAAVPAGASPLSLADDAAVDAFAKLVMDYADTARVRWVVKTPGPVETARLRARLEAALGPKNAHLVDRIAFDGAAATRSLGSTDALAYLDVAPPPPRPCSWRVTLTDPAVPTLDGPAAIPLERGDRLPTSAAGRIEVGFAGPLQSTLYAFGETGSGAIRDLAAATDIAIPVDTAKAETLVLVRARRPVPYLDMIRTRLADQPGARGALGETFALADRFRNGGRGIGANIQLVDPDMIVAENTAAPERTVKPPEGEPVARMDELVETCLYQLTPKS